MADQSPECCLTDNGKEFTDRLFASRARQPSGEHEFDQLCQALGIEHRLTQPKHPQTNGMVERFNGRIADILKTNRFISGEDMEQTLLRYVHLYNHQLPQSALHSRTPIQAMKDWYQSHPQLFNKRPCNQTGCDKLENHYREWPGATQQEPVKYCPRRFAQNRILIQ